MHFKASHHEPLLLCIAVEYALGAAHPVRSCEAKHDLGQHYASQCVSFRSQFFGALAIVARPEDQGIRVHRPNKERSHDPAAQNLTQVHDGRPDAHIEQSCLLVWPRGWTAVRQIDHAHIFTAHCKLANWFHPFQRLLIGMV